MTSSTDAPTGSATFTKLPTPELRSGDLTRLGGVGVLGDHVVEHTLAALVEDARRSARSQGYAVGWAEGRREAAAEAARAAAARELEDAAERSAWQAHQQAAVAALTAAAQALADAAAQSQALMDSRAAALARELTETMVGHELRSAETGGLTAADVATRVLAETPSEAPYVVRVHPDVVATVVGLSGVGVRVVPDPRLRPADAVVEVDEQVVDLRIGSALERVRAVLS